MTCEEYRSRAAFSIEGDQHLAACRQCAAHVLTGDSLPAAAFEAVRRRVLSDIEQSRHAGIFTPQWTWLRWVIVPALAALLAGVFVWYPRRFSPPAPSVAQVVQPPAFALQPSAAALVDEVPRRAKSFRRHTPIRPAAPVKPQPAAEPLVVKMYTEDPNVVIVWLFDKTGD